jgi:hypothetical protein
MTLRELAFFDAVPYGRPKGCRLADSPGFYLDLAMRNVPDLEASRRSSREK